MRKRNIIFSIIAFVAVIAGIFAVSVYNKLSDKFQGEDIRLYFPAQIAQEAFADSLNLRLGPFGANVQWICANLWDNVAPHGSFVVHQGEDALSVARKLRSGAQTPVKVSFNNVRTLPDLAERIASKMEWDGGEFMDACDSMFASKGIRSETRVAYFIPDSYEFYWTSSPTSVVERLMQYHNKFWTDERLKKAKSIGLSPAEVSTLASIVEEETAKNDERPIVARLYLNRMKRGMLLQADPTVKFAVGDFSLRRILNGHLSVESPYNTYKYIGLPPGPIRIPSKQAIDAVLNAPTHNYIYMCAKDDFSGYHNFAVDYNAHLSNAARYHKALTQRKIK